MVLEKVKVLVEVLEREQIHQDHNPRLNLLHQPLQLELDIQHKLLVSN
jgi:hypothetical protein